MPEQLEDSQPAVVAAHDLAVDKDRPDPPVVHGLNDQRIPGSPVMTVNGMVRPCSCPASDKLARGTKTRSTPWLRQHRLRLP